MTLAWAALIEGHLALGSCNCAEEEQRRRPDRRSDYIQQKQERCSQTHALAWQPNSGLPRDKFVYRAAVGVKEPMCEIRGFIDSMLFPLIVTPGERKLTWERVTGRDGKLKTIVVEWDATGQFYDPDGRVAATPQTTRRRVLICRKCGTFVGKGGNDVCHDGHHLWELASLDLDDEELQGDVNARMQDIPISCCANDDKNRRPHIWHPDGPVRCPACGLRRRTGKKYKSIRVYVPLDDELFPP